MKDVIGIIGLGYVGLPLADAFVAAGEKVIGFDTSIQKVENILKNIEKDRLSDKNPLVQGEFIVTNSPTELRNCSVIIVCVPTPLDENRLPDLKYVMDAAHVIGTHLKPGTLVVLESTVSPGTTRDIFLPEVIEISGLDKDSFYLAFSPERVDPGNKNWTLSNTPKLVSGIGQAATKAASELYSKIVSEIVICDSVEIAETSKLLENSFRFINISFINEMLIYCDKIGIDINSVIKAASTKPYGFMAFSPGAGVGGHCIPVDPIYLSTAARKVGVPTRFIDLANDVNQEMPVYFARKAGEKLGGLNGKKLLVIGVSYKPNISDVRESPVEALIEGLKEQGAHVSWHDDLVKEWNGEKSVMLSSNFDLAIIATPHDYLELSALGNVPILNTRGTIK
jgi:UDP-N-acetyl-D-glucosamine dehydrogenase